MTTRARWRPATRSIWSARCEIGDELGGHMVSGHVDGVAESSRAAISTAWRISASARPRALASFIAAKGSVALDGTSLTVNAVEGDDSRSC